MNPRGKTIGTLDKGVRYPIAIRGLFFSIQAFDEMTTRKEGEKRSEHVERLAKALHAGCATTRPYVDR